MTKAPGDGWAYCPEDGRPHRIVRYDHLTDGLLAAYDASKNLVVIDKPYFDALDSLDQGRAMATHTDLFVAVRGGRVSIR